MRIQKLAPERFVHAYDVSFQYVYPWEGVVQPPFGASWGIVRPGEITRPHKHHEGETFFISRGRGILRVDGESFEVESGDVVYLAPFEEHTLENTSPGDDLLFLDVYWEDPQLLAERRPPEDRSSARRVLVTATPPTPNGDLHLGHLSGPYLAADAHTRYLRLRGAEARYLSGVDDHQSYVAFKGEQLGWSPSQTADHFGDRMVSTLGLAGIELDACLRPRRSRHEIELTRHFFRQLYDAGHLVARDAPSLHCPSCDRYLFEAYVRGGCPHCRAPSGGNACEDCGRPNDCADLVEPRCNRCDSPPEVRTTRRLYFPLGRFEASLERFHRSVSMNAHLRALCERMLADGLPDIAVTHPADWGIPVPVEGFEDQRIYVWFEMAPGYLAAAEELGDSLGWQRFWSSPESEVVQFFGFDNGYFHAILFPALFTAFDPSIRLPRTFVTNEFYRLEGSKFSTSRSHAIWGGEFLERHPADEVRFYLAYDNPETEQTSFVPSEFEAAVDRELYARWSPWLGELQATVAAEYGGVAPATGVYTDAQQRFFEELAELSRQAARAYEAETFSLQRAARVLCELVRSARRFARAEEHWRGLDHRRDERRTGVALELAAARLLALAAAPLMPAFSERLWRGLGYCEPLAERRWEDVPGFVPPGQSIGHLENLLPARQERPEPSAAALTS